MSEFWKYITAALTGAGLIFGGGRYVGNLETRIHQLEEKAQRSEARGRYFHGDYSPEETRSVSRER